MKVLKSNLLKCKEGQDLIEYKNGATVVMAYEFNIYNLGESDVTIKFNNEGDCLTLEPGESFDTQFPITHAIIMTDGAVVKYSYWM